MPTWSGRVRCWGRMPYLTARQLEALVSRVERAAADGDTPEWRRVHCELHGQPVELWLPLGELLNPEIAGFVWAWKLCGEIGEPMPPTKGMPAILAQGLEPIVPIAGQNLMDAALLAQE